MSQRTRSAAAAFVLALAAPVAPAAAAVETWEIDAGHTFPSIEFPHMGISTWRGKFNATQGRITIDREAGTGRVEVTVDPASIDFGHEEMNEHARGARWLDVQSHPKARYTGTLRLVDDTPAAVDGELTLRGVTLPLRLEIERYACIEHPLHGRTVCGADARGELHWSDFGLYPREDRAADRVRLLIQVEATRQD